MDKNKNKNNVDSIFKNNQNNIIKDNYQKSEEYSKKIEINKKLEEIGNYILGETIGEGAFAKVKLARHKQTDEKVAIKILNKEIIDINKIRKEIKILQRLKHINIIQLYEIIETKNKLYIVMEYCENQDLFSLIKYKHHLTEIESCQYFQQIINGVEYIHLSKITHRDLKPENLLLTDNNKRIVIIDFGLSISSEEYNSELNTPCGTLSYSPPEMLKGKKYNGIFSDIWSCGIILYVMLVGNLPCTEKEGDLIYQNIITHDYYYPENLSSDAIDLIEHLLKINPNERYNFDEIKAHPWFNLITPKLKPGLLSLIHKIPIDPIILEKAKMMGYDTSKIEESVVNSKYDSFSAVYYLILKQLKRKGINSISDLCSQDYINYLKNYKNWIDLSKINDPLYKDYEIELPKKLEQNDFLEYGMNSGDSDNNNYISVNKSEKFFDLEEKNFENYINSDKMISDMEIKFDNINIFNSFDDSSEIKKNIFIKNTKKNFNGRNKKLNKFKEIMGISSTDSDFIGKRNSDFRTNKNSNSNTNTHIQVNKLNNEKIILLSEKLSQNNKEKILSKLQKEETKFNEDLNIINRLEEKNYSNDNNIIIKIIAEKLINSTIFSKYLIHNKNAKSFLENKFYVLQKYKNIIGLIERMRNKIFTKKLNDFNFYTFNEYLNDDNDKIFVKSLLDIPYFNKFIKESKDTLYKKDFLEKRTFSKYYDTRNIKFDKNNIYRNRLYSSYSNNFFDFKIEKINQFKNKRMAFTPNRNIEYINLRYQNPINSNENINFKSTPYKYKYKNILKTPKSTQRSHYYKNKSRNKYKKYKSAGKIKKTNQNNNPINRRFNTYKNFSENNYKDSCSSFSEDCKKDNKILNTDSEIYYKNSNNKKKINKNSKLIENNRNNNRYNSPRSNNYRSILISPYRSSDKKIYVKLLSEQEEKEKIIRKEKNKYITSLNELKEFIPINLSCIFINKSPNNIILNAKKLLMKKGYFCSNKINENIIKAIKGGSHIELNLYKLKYINNIDNIYLSIKIKSKNITQENNFIKELINYINRTKI